MDELPYRKTPAGLEVFLRVTPKASVNRVQGLIGDAAGGSRLKIQVTAVPEDGKANIAVIKMLSKLWKTPKSNLSLLSGQTDCKKTLLISSDSGTHATVIAAISGL